jgi:hypothetical protein
MDPSITTTSFSRVSIQLTLPSHGKEQDEFPSIELASFLRNLNLPPDNLASILSDLNAAGCSSLELLIILLSIEHSPTFDRWAQGLEEETRSLVKELREDLGDFDK